MILLMLAWVYVIGAALFGTWITHPRSRVQIHTEYTIALSALWPAIVMLGLLCGLIRWLVHITRLWR